MQSRCGDAKRQWGLEERGPDMAELEEVWM